MHIKSFTFNPFQENTYLLYDQTKACIIVDPGCYDSNEEKELSSFIEANELIPKRLINTHAHIDHVFGNAFIAEKYGLEVELHPKDLPTFKMAEHSAKLYGLSYKPSPDPFLVLDEAEPIAFGQQSLQVIFVPGHAPGHVVLYSETHKIMIGGDVLFQNSIGRTDLPGGDHDTLIRNIKEKVFTLPDDVTVFPGHGGPTTIGYEKLNNPFF